MSKREFVKYIILSYDEMIDIYGIPTKLLFTGTFASVYLSSKGYILKKVLHHSKEASTMYEMMIMASLNHPNIIKPIAFADSMQSEYWYTYIIMKNEGTDLHEYLCDEKAGGYIVKDVKIRKRILFQVLMALECLHLNNVFYGDIKMDNILIDKNLNVKLIDFNSSLILKYDVYEKMCVNTYRPPEGFINGTYGKHTDIWGVGMMLLLFLVKAYDVVGDGAKDHLQKIFFLLGTPSLIDWNIDRNWDKSLNNYYPSLDNILLKNNVNLKSDEVDLLKHMLTWESKRISASDALNHPYFNDIKSMRVKPTILQYYSVRKPVIASMEKIFYKLLMKLYSNLNSLSVNATARVIASQKILNNHDVQLFNDIMNKIGWERLLVLYVSSYMIQITNHIIK